MIKLFKSTGVKLACAVTLGTSLLSTNAHASTEALALKSLNEAHAKALEPVTGKLVANISKAVWDSEIKRNYNGADDSLPQQMAHAYIPEITGTLASNLVWRDNAGTRKDFLRAAIIATLKNAFFTKNSQTWHLPARIVSRLLGFLKVEAYLDPLNATKYVDLQRGIEGLTEEAIMAGYDATLNNIAALQGQNNRHKELAKKLTTILVLEACKPLIAQTIEKAAKERAAQAA